MISNFTTYFDSFRFITSLNFSGNHLSNEDVIDLSLCLKSFAFLKQLNLKNTNLLSYSLDTLLSSVLYPYKMDYLNISENPDVDDQNCLVSLQEYYNLEELNMSSIYIYILLIN